MTKDYLPVIAGVLLSAVTPTYGQSTFGKQIYMDVSHPLFRDNFKSYSFSTSLKSESQDATVLPKFSWFSPKDTLPHSAQKSILPS